MNQHLGSLGELLGGISAALTVLCSAFWWTYRRGKTAGRAEARASQELDRLAARVAELERELATMQRRRLRA